MTDSQRAAWGQELAGIEALLDRYVVSLGDGRLIVSATADQHTAIIAAVRAIRARITAGEG